MAGIGGTLRLQPVKNGLDYRPIITGEADSIRQEALDIAQPKPKNDRTAMTTTTKPTR